MAVAPGWYKDPAEPTTQRYWDGEGWIGDPLPADATPPDGPPPTPDPARIPAQAAGAPGSGVPAPEPDSAPPLPVEPPGPYWPSAAQQPPAPPWAPGAPPGPPWPPGASPGPAGPYPPGRPYPPMPPWVVPALHGLPLASPGARLVARLVDIAVVAGLALVANAWFLYEFAREFGPLWAEAARGATPVAGEETGGKLQTLTLLISIVSAAVWLAYEVPAIANSGQTVGKRLLGIKVMRVEAADRVGFGRALGRWTTLGMPTLLWPCCGIGFVLQFIDCLFVATDRPLHQALHDKRAQTVVVQIGQHAPQKPDGGPP